jgi:integrase
VYPAFGSRPIEEVKPADVLEVLKSLERDGASRSAEYVRRMIGQIYDHAIRNLRAEFNPAQSLRGAVVQPAKVSHPHVTERELPAFLSKVDAIPEENMRLAVNLLLQTAVRRGELTGAKWSELDLDRREWRIAPERMKNRREHIVPLSRQAVECFERLKTLAGESEYVLPSPQNPRKPTGRDALRLIFSRMDCGISPHGTRATFSTIANERSGASGDVIEAALAHVQGDATRASYNRTTWLEQRAKLLQWWSDYLTNARSNVVTLPRRA